MADNIFGNTSPATDDLDFITHHLGVQFTVSANRNVIGGRAWVSTAGRPPIFFWQLWRVSDQLMLAESDLNAAGHGTPSNGAWMSFTSALFTTPGDIAIVTGESYICNVFTDDGHFVYTTGGAFPINSGVLSASTGRAGTGQTQNTFPAGTFGNYYFADVTVDVAASAVRQTIIVVSQRRQRRIHRGPILLRTATAPAAEDLATTYTVGAPRGRWHTGEPHSRWDAGYPRGRWHVGLPRGE